MVGADITETFQKAYEFAKDQLCLTKMPGNLSFYKITPGQSLGTILKPDVIYNWSVLEHVERKLMPEIIRDMYQSLNEKGLVFVQIAPLYFSPFGSHLRDYVSEPWAHLELSHENLRLLVEDRDNEALSIEERNGRKWKFSQYELLNKITASACGLKPAIKPACLPANFMGRSNRMWDVLCWRYLFPNALTAVFAPKRAIADRGLFYGSPVASALPGNRVL